MQHIVLDHFHFAARQLRALFALFVVRTATNRKNTMYYDDLGLNGKLVRTKQTERKNERIDSPSSDLIASFDRAAAALAV